MERRMDLYGKLKKNRLFQPKSVNMLTSRGIESSNRYLWKFITLKVLLIKFCIEEKIKRVQRIDGKKSQMRRIEM